MWDNSKNEFELEETAKKYFSILNFVIKAANKWYKTFASENAIRDDNIGGQMGFP